MDFGTSSDSASLKPEFGLDENDRRGFSRDARRLFGPNRAAWMPLCRVRPRAAEVLNEPRLWPEYHETTTGLRARPPRQ